MRKLFIAVVLAGTTLVACSLYLSDDPMATTPDDQTSGLFDGDRDRGHGHRDGGVGVGDASSGVNDSGASTDSGVPGDSGASPDAAIPGDSGAPGDGSVLPGDGSCCDDRDAGLFPDGRRY
jgi:hypothetical protein